MMKKTLLHEVKDIEQEASAVVTHAKERVAEELADIQKHAKETRISIQEKAARTSESIIAERQRAAQEEARKTTEHSGVIASQIHQAAEANRERALAKATILFNEEYGTSL